MRSTPSTIARATLALALTACTGLIDGPTAISGPTASPSAAPSAPPTAPPDPVGPITPPPPAGCATPYAGTRLLRRLTGAEYDRTVGDLLQLDSDHGARFPADPVVDGFANHAGALTVSPLLADQLRVAAEDLARRAAAQLPRLLPCATASGPPDSACADRLVVELGRRAFRRPLTAAESARYRRLYDAVRVAESALIGAEAVLAALLQSPHFLYRSEVGDPAGGTRYLLTAHEIAAQLSYALTGSMPDDALAAAADRGELSTPAQLTAQVERLLATPRARQMATHFVHAWLETDRLATVPKDDATFPELTADVRASMAAATDRLVEHALFDDEGTLEALLRTDVHFVDARLAAFLGVEHPAAGRDAAGFAPRRDPARRGVVGDAGFLTTHARPNASSPVHRGVTIRRRMLCQPLPPPPPGVNAEPPAVDPALTGRERYAAHSADPACQGCHRRIDDIGFGLERFDGAGRWRDREGGRDIDTRGVIEAIDRADVRFDGAAELAEVLAASDEVEACFTAQWASYVWGQTARTELSCELESVERALGDAPVSPRGLMVALARGAHFVERVGPRVDTPVEPVEPTEPVEPPPMEPAPANLSVEERQDSSWDTGYCRTVVVTNRGAADADWSITTAVEGTVSQHWNAERSGDRGTVTWRGVAWNSRIAPGGTASFGYCAAR